MRLLLKNVSFLLIAIGCLYLNRSYSQITAPVEVKITSSNKFETKPKKTITPTFLVKNNSDRKKRFSTTTILPPKWKVNPPDGKFELNPNESEVKIINISIPPDAESGSYNLSYSVEDAVDPSVTASATFSVIVEPVIDVKFELQAKPKYILAGNDYKFIVKMKNESNLPLVTSLNLTISGHPEFKVTGIIDTVNFKLDPGSSRNFEVSGSTDSKIDQKRNYNFHITPSFSNVKDAINFQFNESIEIIPNKYIPGDIWHKIPINFTMRAVTENQQIPYWANLDQNPPRLYGFQGEISGKGTLYENSKDKFEFLVKAPNIQEKAPSFWKRDEYYFKYSSDNYNIILGDYYYNLSFLTDLGVYALGAGGNYSFSNYTFGGFAWNNRWSQIKDNTIATYISYGQKKYTEDTTADLYRVSLNLMNRSQINNRLVASIQGADNHYGFANLDGEFGMSQSDGKSGTAYKLDLAGKLLFADYTARITKGNTDYYGAIRDLRLLNASLKLTPFKRLAVSTYFNQSETNLERDTLLGSAPRNTLMQLGLHNGYILNFAIVVSRYNWENVLRSTDGYTENKVQLSTSYDFGLYRFYGLAELSISKDRMTNNDLSSKRFYFNSSFNVIERLDFGLNANYSEIGNFYLFQNIKAAGLGLNLLWKASYLTTFYLNAATTQYLSDNTKNTYYVENYSYIEAKIEQKLFDNHILALTGRSTLYKSKHITNKIAAMLEYTIPLSIPVSRKISIGILKGKVYDAENPERGIPNIEVLINELSAITDKDGNFLLSYLPPAVYSVSVNKFSLGLNRTTLQKMPVEVSISGGEEKTVNIGIIKASLIKGKILAYEYEESGGVDTSMRKLEARRGMPDFIVQLKNGRPDYFTAISNNKGEFTFPDVPAGKWNVSIIEKKITEYQYLETDSIELLISPGDTREVEFRVLPRKRAAVIAQKLDTVIIETPVIKRDTAIVKPKITINTGIAKHLYFNERLDTLNEQTREYLDRLAEYLKTGNFSAQIEGHSDDRGTPQQREQSATLRMNKVVDYLIKKGVSRQQFQARQFGGRSPLVPNTTASNRQRNRRVSVILNPK